MQLEEVAVLVSIIETGSLSGAARALGLTPMTVSRRLSTLENDLGARLIHRTTRSVSLTPEGEALMPHALTMLEAEEAARYALAPDARSAKGQLRITAPAVFGQNIIMPLIPTLMANHPLLKVECHFTDSLVDLAANGIDLAIRIAPLKDSTLIARRIAPNNMVICAAPGYLAGCESPRTIDDLKHHACLLLKSMPAWQFDAGGSTASFKPDSHFCAGDLATLITACLQGMGLALISFWDVQHLVEQGKLEVVSLDACNPASSFVWAITSTRNHVPLRVQVFLDRLQAQLASLRSSPGEGASDRVSPAGAYPFAAQP
ncbi:MAG TPA: LysR family transcriptional regulator [Pseudomonas sp.]|uniref:LysR family transcriptional regulator n=1 Tax=Pseudomonas sp. TaxID=306 RepID=UPI002B48E1EB|nr:LysR family transcriptional regulator [Pseudomonas sp.]HKS12206.1 LysR family transcriptional regulator [Pseudomonas sp.]